MGECAQAERMEKFEFMILLLESVLYRLVCKALGCFACKYLALYAA